MTDMGNPGDLATLQPLEPLDAGGGPDAAGGTMSTEDATLQVLRSGLPAPAFNPQCRDKTYYKFLFNALPLGNRVRHFRNASAGAEWCHFCPGQVQTLRHFIWTCPLAQGLWREFRDLYSLPQAVTLEQAAFSWSSHVQVLGRRYGYRLQAGHAVAVHIL